MQALSKEALIEKIIKCLQLPPDREIAASDIHLSWVPNKRPNWVIQVDGVKIEETERVMRRLADYDLRET